MRNSLSRVRGRTKRLSPGFVVGCARLEPPETRLETLDVVAQRLDVAAKSIPLVAAFGAQGFDYIGNDAVDMPVWQAARSALATGCSARFW